MGEGYSDKRGVRRARLTRIARMSTVPRIGETVETGFGHSRVSWVDWDPWAIADAVAFVRLDETFSCAQPFDEVLDILVAAGWKDR